MKTKTISYQNGTERWLMTVYEDGTITVTCNGETRNYKLSEPMSRIEQEKDYPEYVRIDVIDDEIGYYLFKFEFNNFFVGDKWTEENVHLGEFAMHVFGEEDI